MLLDLRGITQPCQLTSRFYQELVLQSVDLLVRVTPVAWKNWHGHGIGIGLGCLSVDDCETGRRPASVRGGKSMALDDADS